jgi:divalent metal cation (Fe/Co/Zn/Cd) transporter
VRDLRSALVASVASIIWTALSSAVAVVVGFTSHSVVLVAFGGVGLFDMAGSIALTLHFRHAIRHESFSDRHEAIAHRVVAAGLSIVGLATLIASIIRLVRNGHSGEPLAGVVVAAASIVVLGTLGLRKRGLGRAIPSPALAADGSLSLIGCGTALCTVVGLVLSKSLGWAWPDPVAAIAVAAAAIGLAAANVRSIANG